MDWDDEITDLIIPEKVYYDGYESDWHGFYMVTIIDCRGGFYKKIKSLTIPSSCESIEWGSFQASPNLETVTIGDESGGCKKIGNYAFYECTKLFQVWCHSGLESIGKEAFYMCSSLKNLILPSTVKTIGEEAFKETALESFIFPENVTDVGNRVFQDCKNLKEVKLNRCLKKISDSMFSGCEKLGNITLRHDCESIGENAFGYCTSLKKVDTDNNYTLLKTIGWGAFND